MSQFPTSKENIVINFLYEWLGERRYNRTTSEYAAIARRVPKIEALHRYVNQRLEKMAAARKDPTAHGLCSLAMPAHGPYQICYFQAGDKGSWLADFPTTLSKETVRKAVKKSGLLELRAMDSAMHDQLLA
jgi:hypothetical protein